jgi:protein involved in polysaccharide export with SLBB domain
MRRLSRFLLLSLLVSLALSATFASAQTTQPAPSGKTGAESATISADAFELGEDVEEDMGVITVLGEVPYPGPLVYSDRLSPVEYLLFAGMNPAELDITRVLVGSATGEAAWLTPTTMLLGGERLLVLSPEQAELMQASAMPLEEPDEEADAAPPLAPIVPLAEDESGVRVTGAVERPIRLPYRPRWTVQNYIAASAGLTELADSGVIWVLRSNGRLHNARDITQILPGDTLVVPHQRVVLTDEEGIDPARPEIDPEDVAEIEEPALKRILVTGAVLQTGSFLFQPELSTPDYIRMAGGPTDSANPDGTYVIHRDGAFGGPDELLRAGDVLVVPTRRRDTTVQPFSQQEILTGRAEDEARRQMLDESRHTLRRFGMDYFEGARQRIREIERRISLLELDRQQRKLPVPDEEDADAEPWQPLDVQPVSRSALVQDAITGYVGPLDQLDSNVMSAIPHNRVIVSGDTLHITWWSPSNPEPPQSASLVVAPEGAVLLPPHGSFVVLGKTLEEFERDARDLLARNTFADLRLVATFGSLRTMQVSIVGNVFRAGTYALSNAATLFNALLFSGGPNEAGSLRRIVLKRGDTTYEVDFYAYLLHGDASQDHSLQGGDLIYVAPIGRQVSATGELHRPGIYELSEGEGFRDLMELVGGVRASGFAKSVQIDSVNDFSQRVIRNVDATGDLTDAPPLHDGDYVTVYPVSSDPVNTVQATGYVRQPRVYEFREGMRLSDLIEAAGGLRDDAHRARADLLRRNPDGDTRTLIPIAPDALAKGSDADIPLQAYDRLVVYGTSEVEWQAPRAVAAQGAVVRPGNYARADNMKLSDLLRMAGSVRPEGHGDHALLLRVDDRGRLAISIAVDLYDLATSDPLLEDGDVLLVLTHAEAAWEPAQVVRVVGGVQEPGLIPYARGMRVSDALLRAGGAEGDHASVGLLVRKSERWDTAGESFLLDLDRILADDVEADLLLEPEDEIIVYRHPEVAWEPAQEVQVTGAVQRGDSYPKTEGMRVSDLLFRAGGPLGNAYLERAELYRYMEDYDRQTAIAVDLMRALAGDDAADVLLQAGDMLHVWTVREANFVPESTITVYGAVQRPDAYPYYYGMHLSDVLNIAGGLLPGHRPTVEIARARREKSAEIIRVDVDAAPQGTDSANIDIEPGDVISVLKSHEFQDVPRAIAIRGEVAYPGTYVVQGDERISDLITRAGGLTDRAYPAGATLIRDSINILDTDQQSALEELWQTYQAQNDQDFIREVAKARVEMQRQGGTLEPLTDFVSSAAPLAGGVGASLAAGALATDDEGGSESGGDVIVTPSASAEDKADEVAETVDQITSNTAAAAVVSLVTPARHIDELMPTGAVVIDLVEILEDPSSVQNLTLEPRDVINIPRARNTVSVVGAVRRQNSFVYERGQDLEDYLEFAGGLTDDGNGEAITVQKMSGIVIRAEKVKRIEPGDTIVVPTRVMVEKISNRWDGFLSLARFALTTAATTLVVIAAVKQ